MSCVVVIVVEQHYVLFNNKKTETKTKTEQEEERVEVKIETIQNFVLTQLYFSWANKQSCKTEQVHKKFRFRFHFNEK